MKREMIFESPVYWKKTDDGKDGPYCQACYDKDSIAVRLYLGKEHYIGIQDVWECRVCKSEYDKPLEARALEARE